MLAVLITECCKLEALPTGTSPEEALEEGPVLSISVSSGTKLYWSTAAYDVKQVNEVATAIASQTIKGDACLISSAATTLQDIHHLLQHNRKLLGVQQPVTPSWPLQPLNCASRRKRRSCDFTDKSGCASPELIYCAAASPITGLALQQQISQYCLNSSSPGCFAAAVAARGCSGTPAGVLHAVPLHKDSQALGCAARQQQHIRAAHETLRRLFTPQQVACKSANCSSQSPLVSVYMHHTSVKGSTVVDQASSTDRYSMYGINTDFGTGHMAGSTVLTCNPATGQQPTTACRAPQLEHTGVADQNQPPANQSHQCQQQTTSLSCSGLPSRWSAASARSGDAPWTMDYPYSSPDWRDCMPHSNCSSVRRSCDSSLFAQHSSSDSNSYFSNIAAGAPSKLASGVSSGGFVAKPLCESLCLGIAGSKRSFDGCDCYWPADMSSSATHKPVCLCTGSTGIDSSSSLALESTATSEHHLEVAWNELPADIMVAISKHLPPFASQVLLLMSISRSWRQSIMSDHSVLQRTQFHIDALHPKRPCHVALKGRRKYIVHLSLGTDEKDEQPAPCTMHETMEAEQKSAALVRRLPSVLLKSAKLGNASACVTLAQLIEMQAGPFGRSLSLPWWKKAAKMGDVEGQFRMGAALYKGNIGFPMDAESAHMWLSKVVRQVLGVESLATLQIDSRAANHEHDADPLQPAAVEGDLHAVDDSGLAVLHSNGHSGHAADGSFIGTQAASEDGSAVSLVPDAHSVTQIHSGGLLVVGTPANTKVAVNESYPHVGAVFGSYQAGSQADDMTADVQQVWQGSLQIQAEPMDVDDAGWADASAVANSERHVSPALAAQIHALSMPLRTMLSWSATVLGFLAFDGEVAGGRCDRAEAVRLFRLAAAAGAREAEQVLGWIFNTGQYG